jgi:hypothetical protein
MLHKKLLYFSTWQIDSFEDGSGYEKALTTDSNFVQTRVMSSLTSTIVFTNAVQPSDVMIQLLPDIRESDHWLVNNCLNCLLLALLLLMVHHYAQTLLQVLQKTCKLHV